MSQIQRWDIYGTSGFLIDAEAGPYVLYSDYEALQRENERLRAEIAKPWEHSEHWRNPETGQVECECCCSWALDFERLLDALAALTEAAAISAIPYPAILAKAREALASRAIQPATQSTENER